jgi:AmiR/NasT family two-component response regulator
VASIVLLNVISPSKLSGELELFGHQVWEALDVSEVLFLCEQHRVDAVIIAAEVEGGEIIEKQLRGTVMRLKSNADAAYVDWELSQLFPKKDGRIQ